MIVVITESTETQVGTRMDITGVAEGMIHMLAAHKDRVNSIAEGRVEFALWPQDVVEMLVTELVAESVRKTQ